MPNFDKTGPQGEGKLTGRKMGPCNSDVPRGCGRGRGRGRGFSKGLAIPLQKKED